MSMTLTIALALQMSTPELDAEARENNCNDPQNQAEMNICEGISFQRADLALNAAYRTAIAAAQTNDRELRAMGDTGDTRPGYEAVLRSAQRAWLTYRDQHCTWQGYNDARGGSMEAMVYNGCRAALTRARVGELTGEAEPAQ
jgi:uncharacterized protein YecT (DUF1311 family)